MIDFFKGTQLVKEYEYVDFHNNTELNRELYKRCNPENAEDFETINEDKYTDFFLSVSLDTQKNDIKLTFFQTDVGGDFYDQMWEDVPYSEDEKRQLYEDEEIREMLFRCLIKKVLHKPKDKRKESESIDFSIDSHDFKVSFALDDKDELTATIEYGNESNTHNCGFLLNRDFACMIDLICTRIAGLRKNTKEILESKSYFNKGERII